MTGTVTTLYGQEIPQAGSALRRPDAWLIEKLYRESDLYDGAKKAAQLAKEAAAAGYCTTQGKAWTQPRMNSFLQKSGDLKAYAKRARNQSTGGMAATPPDGSPYAALHDADQSSVPPPDECQPPDIGVTAPVPTIEDVKEYQKRNGTRVSQNDDPFADVPPPGDEDAPQTRESGSNPPLRDYSPQDRRIVEDATSTSGNEKTEEPPSEAPQERKPTTQITPRSSIPERSRSEEDSEDLSLYADVAAILTNGIPPAPEPDYCRRNTDGKALFYRSQFNHVFGDPECGKTWLALTASVEVLRGRVDLIEGQPAQRTSGTVLIIDLDHNGAGPTLSRLLALGADRRVLEDPARFRYCEPEDRTQLEAVVGDMHTWKPDLVVIDSLGELLPLYGANSNSADDFTRVHSRVIKPLVRGDAAVIVIDHMSKGEQSRQYGAGGTIAKKRAVGGVSVRVQAKEPFVPGKGGTAFLTVSKDRHGNVRKHCKPGIPEHFFGVFKLIPDTSIEGLDVLRAEIWPPKEGETPPDDFGGSKSRTLTDDVKKLEELELAPESLEDVKKRCRWGSDRASAALKEYRRRHGTDTTAAASSADS